MEQQTITRRSQEIQVQLLHLSDKNVRQEQKPAENIEELKASIHAQGILQNLLVRKDKNGGFDVIAGGRRLRAVVELIDEGKLQVDYGVPCLVQHGAQNDTEASLVENTSREEMHPADEFEAFRKLHKNGMSTDEIAARTGYNKRLVQQRLRLGNVAPELIQKYRAEEMDLDRLMAFTVSTDHAAQLQAYKQASERSWWSSHDVRQALTDKAVHISAGIAKFVGLKAYQAAGGEVNEDLFSELDGNYYLVNRPLVQELANKKLETKAIPLRKKWKWVETAIEVPWSLMCKYGTVKGKPGTPTEKETAQLAQLAGEEKALLASDDKKNEAAKKARAQRSLTDKIEKRRTFTKREHEIAGCMVVLDHQGHVQIHTGMIRPEDIPKPKVNGEKGAPSADNGPGEPDELDIQSPLESMDHERPQSPEAKNAKETGLPISVKEDLECIRTSIVRKHLVDNFDAAFDLLTFTLVTNLAKNGYGMDALDVRATPGLVRPHHRRENETFTKNSPAETAFEQTPVANRWLELDTRAEQWSAYVALPIEERQRLMSHAVALMLMPQLAHNHAGTHAYEATVERLKIDFAAETRPSAEILWKRVKKDLMLQSAKAVLSPEWAQKHKNDKRSQLATNMAAAYAGQDESVDEDGKSRAAAWTIPGFKPFDKRQLGSEPWLTGQPDNDAAAEQGDANNSTTDAA